MSRSAAVFLRDPVSKQETLLGTFESEGAIGKSPSAKIIVDNLRCDDLHVLVEEDKAGEGFLIVDLGSHSGTYLKGKRVDEAKLKYGDVFTVGNQQLVLRKIESAEGLSVGALSAGQPRPVTPKGPVAEATGDLLQVALYWGETLLEMRTFTPGGIVTLGAQKEATFPVTLKDPKFQKFPFPVAKYKRKQLQVNIPAEATGLIWIGEETFSLDYLRHKDNSNTDFSDLALTLTPKDRADINFGELTLSFRFISPAKKLPIDFFASLDQTFIKIGSGLLAIYALMFFWISNTQVQLPEKTLDDLPKELKRAVYNAGLAKAAQRRQSAIGQLARDNEGGRAKGEEGRASAIKSPVVTKKPELKPPNKAQKPTKVATQAPKRKDNLQANKSSPNKARQSQASEGEKPINVDIDSAFSGSPEKNLGAKVNAVGTPGKEQNGNTIAAFADPGSFARGRKGQGAGGGGQSVGIGTLKGTSTGGGEGAGDFGVLRSKGHEIKVPDQEEIVILGGLDREVIAGIVRRYLPQIQHCYEQQLVSNPKLKGKVTVAWTISGTGSVQSAQVDETSLNNEEAENCMVQKILGWKFPKPRGGGTVGVKYPFMLMSSAGSKGD